MLHLLSHTTGWDALARIDGLIRNPVADHVDPGETAHVGHLDQRLFHASVAERLSLLREVNPQQPLRGGQGLCGQREGRSVDVRAGPGVVMFDQVDYHLLRHNCLLLSQDLLASSAFLGCGLLVLAEPELRAASLPWTWS